MSKAPSLPFYVRDWLTDTELRSAEPWVRGLWMDALCYMWLAPKRGTISGTIDELSRLLSVPVTLCNEFVTLVKRHCIGVVTERGGVISISNRRMLREERARQLTNERVKKHRRNAPVTAMYKPPAFASAFASASASAKIEDKEGVSLSPTSPPEPYQEWLGAACVYGGGRQLPEDADSRQLCHGWARECAAKYAEEPGVVFDRIKKTSDTPRGGWRPDRLLRFASHGWGATAVEDNSLEGQKAAAQADADKWLEQFKDKPEEAK
ncbi:MAG: hypothetical protein IMZ50_16390 [Candidatus Atribacteria bacterium]|nr:hypothetical protein [Candidatus Atribacteria bacterium]